MTYGPWLAWIGAGALLVASIYCALWFFAASDLAFIPCNGHFSVFAPCVVLVLFAAGVLLFAYRRRKRLAGDQVPDTDL
jgi:hypothetical protein